MPAGFHVASAYVDIHAEDAGLRGEIRRAIEAAAAGEDGKVKLNVDTSNLRSKVDAAVKAAGTNQKVKVSMNLDTSGLRSKVSAAMAAAGTNQKVKVSINVDTAGLRSKVSAAIAAAGTNQKVKVGLDLDTSGFRAKVSAAVAAAGTNQKVKVSIDLDNSGLRTKVSAAVAEAGAGQNVHVGTNNDRNTLSSLGSGLRSLVRDSGRAERGIRDLDRTANRTFGSSGILNKRSGLGGLSVGSLAGLLTMAEPIMGSLFPAIKNIGLASAALVPAFIGAATAGTALFMGTRGVGKAFKDAHKDAVDYGVGLNNLAPSAQDFVRSAAGMNGALTSMRMPVQNALFKGLGQQLQNLGKTALPVVTAGLTGMAGIMNKMASGVMTTVGNLAKSGALQQMFGGIQNAFKPLTAIPGQMVNVLTKVAAAASPLLGRITTAMGGQMKNLSDYIDRSFASGALQANISKAGAAIGKFFTNFKNNDAVQQMFQNMKTQGPQVAHALQQMAEGGLKLLNSSSGIGTALLKIGGGLAHVVNAIPTGALTTIMGAVGAFRALSLVGTGLSKAQTAIRGFASSLTGVASSSSGVARTSTALSGLASSGGRASTILSSGALSATAIRARAAAMTTEGIAVRGLSTRLAQAGTPMLTIASGAAVAGGALTQLKAGAIGLTVAYLGMKGTDAVMNKIFGQAPNIKQMSASMVDFAQTGKLTGNTAKYLGDNFQKFGKALGDEVHNDPIGKIKNALGRTLAWTGLDAFKDKNKDLKNSVDDTLASLVKAGHSDIAGKVFDSLTKSASKNGVSVDRLKKSLGDYSQALTDQKTAEKIAAISMGTFGNEAIKTQKIIGANKGELQGMQGSYYALGRFNASATGAQLAYNQSVSQAQSMLKKHSNALSMTGGLLNTTTPKAQAAAGAMLNIAEAAKKAGEGFRGKGDFAAEAKTIDQARASIMALGKAQGLTAAQAREFTNQVLPIDRAKLWGQAIASTAGQVKTLTAAMAKAPAAQKLFNFSPNTFTSQARAGLDSLKGVVTKTLDNGKIQVKVDTSSAKRQVGELGKVMASLKSKGTQTLKMPTKDIGAMSTAAKAMGMAITKLPDGKIKITAQDGASVIIQGVKAKVEALTAAGAKVKVAAPNIKGADTSVGKSIASTKQFVAGISKGAPAIAANTAKQNQFNTSVGKSIQGAHQFVAGISAAGPPTKKAYDNAALVHKILTDPKMQGHPKFMQGLSGLSTDLGNAAPKAKAVSDAVSKLAATGKSVRVQVQISGTEQIGKLTALNAVKNKSINVQVNISGTEQIGKLTALNAVKNKNINVQVNISGTEQIGKLTALNAVKNKYINVQVNISGTEQINKLTALNKVNNKSINVQVNISGAESINKLKALNQVNNKSITVSVHISGADQITKLKALNQVNNKSVTVSVHVSGADQITKLKALNQVNNKSVTVSVHVSGADQIAKLKGLNQVANKHISVSVNIQGAASISKLQQIKNFPSSKHITVTVSANAGGVSKVKSAIDGIKSKSVHINVSADTGAVSKVKSAIDGIKSKSVNITVSADTGAVSGLKSAIDGIKSKSVQVTATADTGAVSGLKDAIAAVKSKSVTITANVSGTGAVQGLASAIDAVHSKTVTVTVKTVKTGSAATGGLMSNSSLPGFSDGGSSYMRSYKSAGPVVGPGSGLSDSILARISNGEFIIRASMVKKYGPEMLAAINNGAYNPIKMMKHWGWKLPGFWGGGYAGHGGGRGDWDDDDRYYNRRGSYNNYRHDYNGSISKSVATFTTYTIRWGDTLTSIARKFGTTVDALVKLNHISNPDRIYAGNKLKIPGVGTLPGSPPAVLPGTKPGDWNYLAPPNFGKLSRKQSDKKDASEVDDITLYMGASTYRDNRYFSNLMGTNPDTITGHINSNKDATDVSGLASDLDKLRELGMKAFNSGSSRDKYQAYIAAGGKIELQY
ncbi:MAG: LysM peptidoglycan-binding domain-containing protein, partial [Actinobacteria bacterium]|nr:LysM peptidoglycan-binding domain-containing protein [Actinomycetota bacterium]